MNYPHGHTCEDCGAIYRPCLCRWPDVKRGGRCPGCRADNEDDMQTRMLAVIFETGGDAEFRI